MRLKSLIICVILFQFNSVQAQLVIEAMSLNIRYDNPSDGPNAWSNRKEALQEFVDSVQPHFIGMQEVLHHQLLYLDSSLTDYSYVGVGRDDGALKGEYAPIFHRKDLYELVFYRNHWLSETPDTVSIGWDAALPRIAGFAKFRHLESGKHIMVVNTHFDHIGKQALDNSSMLIDGLIKQYSLMRPYVDGIILTGDFNAEPNHIAMRFLASQYSDAFQVSSAKPHGPMATFNGFKPELEIEKRIDYIYTKGFEVEGYRCLQYLIDGKMPISDHWPIWVRLSLED